MKSEWLSIGELKKAGDKLYFIFYIPHKPPKEKIVHRKKVPHGATHFMYVSSPEGDITYKKPVSNRNSEIVRFINDGNSFALAAKEFSISATNARRIYITFKDRI